MTVEKPEGFVYRDIPKTRAEAIAQNSTGEILNLVKAAVHNYLNQWFSQKGKWRSLLETMSPSSVQFITDIRVPRPDEYRDPTKYSLQIARMWQDLRARMPCIVINEGGWNRKSYLDNTASTVPLPGTAPYKYSLWTTNFLMGSLDLIVGSMDETTTGQIGSALVNIFGTLRDITKSSVITGKNWEVRLPLTFDIGARERVNVTDDPKDSYWQLTLTLNDVHFESVAAFEVDRPIPVDAENVDLQENDPLSQESFPETVITAPTEVKLGRVTPFSVANIPYDALVYSDDPRVALVRRGEIIGRKTGTFNLVVARGTNVNERETHVYASQEISVVLI